MRMKKLESGYDVLVLLAMTVMMLVVVISSPYCTVNGQRTTGVRNVDVGLILDTKISFGKTSLSTVKLAISDFYASNPHFTTRIVLHSRHSSSDVVDAAASALDLIQNEKVQVIIGPESSMQANFVINLGNKAQIPIVTFSATSPTLASIRSPFFFRVAANDSSQVRAIAAVVKAFGWRQAVPIYVDNEYGEGVIPYLTDALQSVDTRVPYRSVIPPEASDDFIAAELYKLMTMSTRVFVVHMLPELGARIFAAAKGIGMMGEGYVWIVTDGIAEFFRSQNSTVIETMQGVLGVKTFVPKSDRLESFVVRLKAEFRRENPTVVDDTSVLVFGLWAYDTIFALATAIEETSKTGANFGFRPTASSNSSRNSTDLESLPVSRSGSRLAESLSGVRFRGLSGDFKLVNGQLQTPNYEIVNVFGSGERRLGFWTMNDGLAKTLRRSNKPTTYSARNTSLGPVFWPGDSTFPPKGWQFPTKDKILRIGVPVKTGFQEFVRVSIPFSNETVFGYTIDVFRAVLGVMPYAVPFEFVPFEGTYDNLVYQVYDEKFDAAVGDVTIRKDRSLLVDFTLPYTESGVSMLVPIKDYKSRNAWVFLKPLTWDLWVATVGFFIFIGFMVWVLEHRKNKDFQGSVRDQIGTSLWYSFSTMVFGHREKVESNWARFVVIVWCFVVLILIQSYTASLTSRLTVQQLRPVITDVNQLLKNRENVGYQTGSFVVDLLKGMGFNDDQLKIYNSTDELFNLFESGTTKGGISAAFDETPYIKLFLAKHCSKFTMVEPTFKADGFGFAFPKGSPLVPDVSRAILHVTEGQQMKDIESVWFKKEPTCPDPSTLLSSDRLSLENFWGLFLIAGAASVLAFFSTIAVFLHEQRATLMRHGSLWTNIRDVFREFNRFHENGQINGAQIQEQNEAPVRRDFGNVQLANSNGSMSPSSGSTTENGQINGAQIQEQHVSPVSRDFGDVQVANSNGSMSPSSGSTTPLTSSGRENYTVPKDINVASSSAAQTTHETELIVPTTV